MNIPPSEADKLSLYRYESILWNWNDAHKVDDVEPPDPEMAMEHIARIKQDPRLTGPREPVN